MWKPFAVRRVVVLTMLVALLGSTRQAQTIPIRFEDAELLDSTLFGGSTDGFSAWNGPFDPEDSDEPVFYPDPKRERQVSTLSIGPAGLQSRQPILLSPGNSDSTVEGHRLIETFCLGLSPDFLEQLEPEDLRNMVRDYPLELSSGLIEQLKPEDLRQEIQDACAKVVSELSENMLEEAIADFPRRDIGRNTSTGRILIERSTQEREQLAHQISSAIDAQDVSQSRASPSAKSAPGTGLSQRRTNHAQRKVDICGGDLMQEGSMADWIFHMVVVWPACTLMKIIRWIAELF